MIGDPVPHARSLLVAGARGRGGSVGAAIYHGACWVPARPPVSPSLPLARVIWPVFTTTLRPASVVAAAERNELWNGRTSGASPGAFARFFFFCLRPEFRARLTRGAAGPGARSRCDPVGAIGQWPRGPRGAERGAARVTCPFVRQPAEHVEAGQGSHCGGRSAAGLVEWWLWVAPVASVPCSLGRKKWLPLFE